MLATLMALLNANPDATDEQLGRADKWLRSFGYLHPQHNLLAETGSVAVDALSHAIGQAQDFAGLPKTGRLDPATVELMSRPRCGCKDIQRLVAPEEARWRKTTLNYYVEKYVNGLSVQDQDDIIRLAWNQWQDVANVKTVQVISRAGADIIISTGSGPTDDFDGPSGTLAWAYMPTGMDGQLLMRFDLSERWVKDTPNAGILMLNVACHEFGHLLGLDHSRVQSALMAPYYSPNITKPQSNDDIPRIQALYGAVAPTPQPPQPPQPQPPGGNPVDPTTREAAHKALRWFDDLMKAAAAASGNKLLQWGAQIWDNIDDPLLDLVLDRFGSTLTEAQKDALAKLAATI